MELLMYFIMLVVGIILVVVAVIQKRIEGNYNRLSRTLLNVGAVFITYALIIKLPQFIVTIIAFWKGD